MLKQASNVRICSKCGSNKTYVDNRGYELWYKDLCKKCYHKYIGNKHRNPITRKKWHDLTNHNHLLFMGKHIIFKFCPRIGVCNWCRAVVPFDCKQTHLHHERYDQNSPLKHTIELCASCHTKESRNIG